MPYTVEEIDFQSLLHMPILPTTRVNLERIAGGVEVPPLVVTGLLLEGLPPVAVSSQPRRLRLSDRHRPGHPRKLRAALTLLASHSRLPLAHVGDELLLGLGLLNSELDHLSKLALDSSDVVTGLLDDLQTVVGERFRSLAVDAGRGNGREAEESLRVERLKGGQRLRVDLETGDAGRLLERPVHVRLTTAGNVNSLGGVEERASRAKHSVGVQCEIYGDEPVTRRRSQ